MSLLCQLICLLCQPKVQILTEKHPDCYCHFIIVAVATNLCFSADKGQLLTRVDLADAPNCALAKGASVAVLGNVVYCL